MAQLESSLWGNKRKGYRVTKRKLKNKVHYLTYNIYKYQVLTEDFALVNPTCIGLSVVQERLYSTEQTSIQY